MQTSTTSTDLKTDSTTQTTPSTGYVTPEATPEPKSTEETFADDFGYGDDPEEPKPAETEQKPAEDQDDKPFEKKATGYEEEAPKPVEDQDKNSETEEENSETEQKVLKEEDVKTLLGDLPDGYDKEKTSKFAIENNMSKEQLEAYVNFTKNESIEIKKAQEQAIVAQRSTWYKELSTDPDFGGENFVKNIDRVEKFLDKYTPNIKKILTERGTMLPPYIMKDFLSLSKTLNPTTKLINGDPSVPIKTESNFLDDLYE